MSKTKTKAVTDKLNFKSVQFYKLSKDKKNGSKASKKEKPKTHLKIIFDSVTVKKKGSMLFKVQAIQIPRGKEDDFKAYQLYEYNLTFLGTGKYSPIVFTPASQEFDESDQEFVDAVNSIETLFRQKFPKYHSKLSIAEYLKKTINVMLHEHVNVAHHDREDLAFMEILEMIQYIFENKEHDDIQIAKNGYPYFSATGMGMFYIKPGRRLELSEHVEEKEMN